MSQLTAREALEKLPGKMSIPRGGGVKVFAVFSDGRLLPGVKIALVRIPPQAIGNNGSGWPDQRMPATSIDRELLERAAYELGLAERKHA